MIRCQKLLVGLAALVLTLTLLSSCGADGADVSSPAGGVDLSDPDAGPESPSGRTLLEGFTEVKVVVTAADDTTQEFCMLLADEAAEWAQGLMQVTDLGDYDGMVFEFEEGRNGGFFMRNTPTPLSIAFLDESGALISTADMEPCEDRDGCPTYGAEAPYRFAVEVRQGDLAAIGLDDRGAALQLADACTPV